MIPGQPSQLQEYWFNQALQAARIERYQWHPDRGVQSNRRIIPAVYDYYGQLYLRRECLEWAGMANLIAPTLYAGIRDLGFLPDLVRRGVAATFGRASRRLAARMTGAAGWYESTFLSMQKKVFEDQATMHQAYLDGGLKAIDDFHQAGIIDLATRDAWRQIDSGDTVLIGRGNCTLLFREQLDILGRFYTDMFRYRGAIGRLVTYTMTLAGRPSVPGARPFGARYPFVLKLPRTVGVQTPLASGNIALFVDRWKLIENDTLPSYLSFIHDSPETARKIIGQPVSERMTSHRLLAEAGQFALTALTRWKLDLAVERTPPRRPARQPRLFDLTRPPTRESAGFADGELSKAWMDPRPRPFDVRISLPQARAYQAEAELAVMRIGGRGDEPDRLAVQLPAMRVDATATLLKDLAAEWGFPAEAVAAWNSSANHPGPTDRHYTTQVFTCSQVGFVTFEFQVAHHVQDRKAVITALFTWGR